MPDGSTAPATSAGNILSFLDSIEAAINRGETGDALALLEPLRAAHQLLVVQAQDLGVGLGNAISLVNVAALALHYQCTDADGDVADLLDRCAMAELHGCRDSLEEIQRYAGAQS